MREIKFRVWFENVKRGKKKGNEIIWHTKSYYDYNPIIDNNGLLEVESGWDICGNSDENYFLEQYTGLKDKNGKEIYEGDIVLDYYDGEDTFIVKWDKDAVSFILTDTDNIVCVNFYDYFPDKELEVIGNIHENQELLKEKE